MSNAQEIVTITTTINSEAEAASGHAAMSPVTKKGTTQSEVRTVRSITSELPEDLRSKAKEVFDAVQSSWKVYVSKDNALRQSRADLAVALIETRKLLEDAGKKRLFHYFLAAKGIPKSTAYDLIKDYERSANAPEVLKKAAEMEGVDLAAQRHAVELQQVIDSNEPLSEEQALDVVSRWRKKKLAGSVGNRGTSDLSEYEKQVCSTFASIKKAAGKIPEESRPAVLMEALQYYFYYCAGQEEPITIEPAAAEDDWVIQQKTEPQRTAIAAELIGPLDECGKCRSGAAARCTACLS